jgi:hypothetical protein
MFFIAFLSDAQAVGYLPLVRSYETSLTFSAGEEVNSKKPVVSAKGSLPNFSRRYDQLLRGPLKARIVAAGVAQA